MLGTKTDLANTTLSGRPCIADQTRPLGCPYASERAHGASVSARLRARMHECVRMRACVRACVRSCAVDRMRAAVRVVRVVMRGRMCDCACDYCE